MKRPKPFLNGKKALKLEIMLLHIITYNIEFILYFIINKPILETRFNVCGLEDFFTTLSSLLCTMKNQALITALHY